MVVYGAKILYFTRKFEVYLRHKGLPYEFRPLDCRRYLAVRRRLGATQYPTVRLDDGRWTRTSGSGAPPCTPLELPRRPPARPQLPRPRSLHLPLPIELRRRMIAHRKTRLRVSGDGIDRRTRSHAKGSYLRALDQLRVLECVGVMTGPNVEGVAVREAIAQPAGHQIAPGLAGAHVVGRPR